MPQMRSYGLTLAMCFSPVAARARCRSGFWLSLQKLGRCRSGVAPNTPGRSRTRCVHRTADTRTWALPYKRHPNCRRRIVHDRGTSPQRPYRRQTLQTRGAAEIVDEAGKRRRRDVWVSESLSETLVKGYVPSLYPRVCQMTVSLIRRR